MIDRTQGPTSVVSSQRPPARVGAQRARGRSVRVVGVALAALAGTALAFAALAQGGSGGGSGGGQAPATGAGRPASNGAARASGASSPATSDLVAARRQAFEVTTTANGELQARNQIELRSALERNSTIQFIVPEGSRVAKGDVLVRLNGDEIQRQIDEQTPRLASAEAELIAAENGYQIQLNDNDTALRKAQLDLTLAELALRQWREGDAVKRRQTLETRVETARLELDRLADRFRRSQGLLAEGFVSKDERDRDEVAYLNAISAFQSAVLDLEVYETYEFVRDQKQREADVEQRRAEVERVRLNNERQLANRDAQRKNQRQQLALIQSNLERLKDQLAKATITAPNDGLVVYATSIESGGRWGGGSEQPLQIGQQVFPNQLIIVLPDTSEMVAAIRVAEAIAGRIRPGQPVQVRVDAAGGRLVDGVVESIGVMAETGGWRDPNLREYTVRVTLNTSGVDGLKPAMRVESRVILDRVPETLTVPIQALFSEGPVQFVYVQEGNRFRRLPVAVGRRSETLAEVSAGLDEGRIVLVRTPSPGEVLQGEWIETELASAGYSRDAEGNIVAPRRGRPGGMPPGMAGGPPGGMPGGMPAGVSGGAGQRPRGAGTGRPGQPGQTPATPTPSTAQNPGAPAAPAGTEAPAAAPGKGR